MDAIDKIVQRPPIKTPDGKVMQPAPEELAAKKTKRTNYLYWFYCSRMCRRLPKNLIMISAV
jgi:hypothetical protein